MSPLHQAAAREWPPGAVRRMVGELEQLGPEDLARALHRRTRFGHVPSRPSAQRGSRGVNDLLDAMRADYPKCRR